MLTLKQQVERKRKLIVKHQSELAALLKTCSHDEVESRTHYYEGSYLNKAQTEHKIYCALCGKQTQEPVTITHSWYG